MIWKFQEFLMPMATSIPFVGAGVTLLSKSIELLVETTKNYHEISQARQISLSRSVSSL
jgi:hypothetical protein